MSTNTIGTLPLVILVGPPNSGKTTLFNFLSGKNYKTVNYPGATVEYSISRLQKKFNLKANILDSPGIVSLYPNSPDEKVSIEALYSHPSFGIPDLVLVTADASQLSRHLLLVKQLIEAKFNVIVVLTMSDILYKKGYDISIAKLSKELSCKVVKVDGRNGNGTDELIKEVREELKNIENGIKQKPVRLDNSVSFDKLIKDYRLIEEIEQRVIFENNGKTFPDIKNANQQLAELSNYLKSSPKNKIDQTTLKIDKLLLHKVWGLVFFLLIMAVTFTSIFWLAQPLMELVDSAFGYLSTEAVQILGNNWLSNFIANGVITGTGAVLVFVPQIMILFLILGFLEDTGYLARGAMLIDKPLSKIGLNGRSFVPMLSGFACAIPAIMATRTIPNKRERFLTIFIIPLLSCSARLPVYALLLAFLFPENKSWIAGLVLASIYIFSIIASTVTAGIINKFSSKIIKEEDNSSFILELPTYKIPKLKVILNNTYHSSMAYVKKAGTIILFLSIIIWFLTYFPDSNPKINANNLTQEQIEQLTSAERISNSYASDLGKFIQPIMKPLGLDWRVGVSLIPTFAAREVFVSSLALIFKVTGDKGALQSSILKEMRRATISDTGKKLFTTSTIVGLIIYFIFALQCISTMAIARKETGSWRIPIVQLILFTLMGYIFALLAVNSLKLFGVG
jgi:ferrous iron transport protein B